MLTGDENIIDIKFVVFWVINDAEKFLFHIRNPNEGWRWNRPHREERGRIGNARDHRQDRPSSLRCSPRRPRAISRPEARSSSSSRILDQLRGRHPDRPPVDDPGRGPAAAGHRGLPRRAARRPRRQGARDQRGAGLLQRGDPAGARPSAVVKDQAEGYKLREDRNCRRRGPALRGPLRPIQADARCHPPQARPGDHGAGAGRYEQGADRDQRRAAAARCPTCRSTSC